MNNMSVVDDMRKVLQDFLAPELRTITARLDGIEKVMAARFEAVDAKLDAVYNEIHGISDKLDLDRHLTKLESQQASKPQ